MREDEKMAKKTIRNQERTEFDIWIDAYRSEIPGTESEVAALGNAVIALAREVRFLQGVVAMLTERDTESAALTQEAS